MQCESIQIWAIYLNSLSEHWKEIVIDLDFIHSYLSLLYVNGDDIWENYGDGEQEIF